MSGDAVRYKVRLSIGYQYGAPSDHTRTIVRLLPSDVPGRQRVFARFLEVTPHPSERREITDFFGNATALLWFHTPIDAIEFTLSARAERLASEESLDLSPRLPGLTAELSMALDLTSRAPHHFLGASTRAAPDAAIAAFAKAHADPALTVTQVVEAIGQVLHAEMRFDPDATHVDTPAADAFEKRHGVCQDYSHIMIVALRALGVPALYVSGFLRTIPPPGKSRLEGADAMHAWVSAWCGAETGWVEYDPTNACFVGQDHIVVAYGRDYSDAAPVRGTLRTSGSQASYQRVDVEPQ